MLLLNLYFTQKNSGKIINIYICKSINWHDRDKLAKYKEERERKYVCLIENYTYL